MVQKVTLQIPVEVQLREFDAKLLLACIAAKRGFYSVIGSRQELKLRIASFPESIYISKDLKSGSGKMYRIMRKFGYAIVAWDEEALINLYPEIYYRARWSPKALKYVSHLFAWGRNNAELWRESPILPDKTPIHITGNPRGDLLRPEMHGYYNRRVEELCETHGDFILFNTNFTGVNAVDPTQNIFEPVNKQRGEPKLGRALRFLDREYAESAKNHVQAIFEDFKKLIPLLDQAFPDFSIIVRPHPGENQQVYHEIASQCERVRVTKEGNVVPWLLATKALIHNGCTTGLEAYAIGVPTIAYRATVDEYHDNGVSYLPNILSHQCFNFEELRVTLQRILAGELGPVNGDEQRAIFNHYMAAREGPLACERIVDVLCAITEDRNEWPNSGWRDRLEGRYMATKNVLKRSLISCFPHSRKNPWRNRHHYPGVSLEEVRARVSLLQQVRGENSELNVDKIGHHLFRISA